MAKFCIASTVILFLAQICPIIKYIRSTFEHHWSTWCLELFFALQTTVIKDMDLSFFTKKPLFRILFGFRFKEAAKFAFLGSSCFETPPPSAAWENTKITIQNVTYVSSSQPLNIPRGDAVITNTPPSVYMMEVCVFDLSALSFSSARLLLRASITI